jgi:hypothetical protein
LERLCAEVIVRSERHLFQALTTDLTEQQRIELDSLLKPKDGSKVSTFAWLRSPPGAPTTHNILLHIERLREIRSLELRPDLGQRIHQNRLLQLAREGAATTTQHLARFDDPRRYGTLVAVLLEASATLTDEILDLHDRFIGSIFNKARRRRDEAFQSSGKAINEKVRLYARIGQALLTAKQEGGDPFAAIERIVSWDDFARTVSEAEQLAQPEDFDFLSLVSMAFRRRDGTRRPCSTVPRGSRRLAGGRDVLRAGAFVNSTALLDSSLADPFRAGVPMSGSTKESTGASMNCAR